MKSFLLIPLLILLSSYAAFAELQQDKTGYSWLKMTDTERLDYVMTSLYILSDKGVECKGSPNAYLDAIGEKLDKNPELYDANVTNILASVIYETEPGTREALDELKKHSQIKSESY